MSRWAVVCCVRLNRIRKKDQFVFMTQYDHQVSQEDVATCPTPKCSMRTIQDYKYITVNVIHELHDVFARVFSRNVGKLLLWGEKM